jgi:hypothetical protein
MCRIRPCFFFILITVRKPLPLSKSHRPAKQNISWRPTFIFSYSYQCTLSFSRILTSAHFHFLVFLPVHTFIFSYSYQGTLSFSRTLTSAHFHFLVFLPVHTFIFSYSYQCRDSSGLTLGLARRECSVLGIFYRAAEI